jgi:dethiobiotin synthetase
MSGPARFVIAGTDTGVGKTVFAAALAGALGALYWKPVQTGADSDSETVASLSGLARTDVLPEAYRLTQPLSPHRAAELDDVRIDAAKLVIPAIERTLVIVPVTRDLLFADLFARWGRPVVVVARTALGTINHSLLSVEALRARGVPIHGVAFVGEAMEDSEATIAALGDVRRLGRLPPIASLNSDTLRAAFSENFSVEDFQ